MQDQKDQANSPFAAASFRISFGYLQVSDLTATSFSHLFSSGSYAALCCSTFLNPFLLSIATLHLLQLPQSPRMNLPTNLEMLPQIYHFSFCFEEQTFFATVSFAFLLQFFLFKPIFVCILYGKNSLCLVLCLFASADVLLVSNWLVVCCSMQLRTSMFLQGEARLV